MGMVTYLNGKSLVGYIKVYFNSFFVKEYLLIRPVTAHQFNGYHIFEQGGFNIQGKQTDNAIVYEIIFGISFLLGQVIGYVLYRENEKCFLCK